MKFMNITTMHASLNLQALQNPTSARTTRSFAHLQLHRARSLSAGTACSVNQTSTDAVPSGRSQHKDMLLTLERSIGSSFGSEVELRRTGAFQAEVFPDLPAATTWGGMWRKVSR